jgi:tetratricopeptide (TPR) repeat protein
MTIANTDTFFADVETVIATFAPADEPRIRQMLAELEKIAGELPHTAARCFAYQARLHSKLGEHAAALAAVDRAIATAPRAPNFRVVRGRMLAAAGRLLDAIAEFDRVLAAEPDAAQTLVLRGDAYKALGDTARARADYTAALNLEPGSQPIKDRLKELGRA